MHAPLKAREISGRTILRGKDVDGYRPYVGDVFNTRPVIRAVVAFVAWFIAFMAIGAMLWQFVPQMSVENAGLEAMIKLEKNLRRELDRVYPPPGRPTDTSAKSQQ
jgi:hypothetical protein